LEQLVRADEGRQNAGRVEFNPFSDYDQKMAEDYEAGRSFKTIRKAMEERDAAGNMKYFSAGASVCLSLPNASFNCWRLLSMLRN
jgi:hypothetical protein